MQVIAMREIMTNCNWCYRPGVHEACLAQLVRVVRRDMVALNAAHGAPLARLAAALALNPN